ncbi:MAG: 50S ribosomal protein L10 [Clostridiales bacterium]|nr:50S ribosomal protein L10 [Clostridiales bacterium]
MKKIPEAKVTAVADIKEKIKKSAGIALVDYKGLTVEQDTALRNDMRGNKVDYSVVKNTILRRAFNDLGIKDLDKYLKGPTAIALSYDDEIAAAKISSQNAAKYNKIALKAGYAEGKALNAEEINALAKIPGKEVLIAQILGLLTSPVRSLAVALSQIAEKKA